jgi:hypothetical protein
MASRQRTLRRAMIRNERKHNFKGYLSKNGLTKREYFTRLQQQLSTEKVKSNAKIAQPDTQRTSQKVIKAT